MNQRFRERMMGEVWLFPEEDPNNPAWCGEAFSVIQAGTRLLQTVRHNPTAPVIAWALHLLERRYWRAYEHADPEHRRDEGHATHPCIHRAWREMRWAIEDLELDAAVAELLPPLPPPPVDPMVDEAVEPEPGVPEEPGVTLGILEDDDDDERNQP